MKIQEYDVELKSKNTSRHIIKKQKIELLQYNKPIKKEKKELSIINNYNNYTSNDIVQNAEEELKQVQQKIIRQILKEWKKVLASILGLDSEDYKNTSDMIDDFSKNILNEPRAIAITTRETTVEYKEENIDFQASGSIITSDGRKIPLNMNFYCENDSIKISSKETTISLAKQIDPLIINIDSKLPELSDITIDFDLDVDGKKDKINFTNYGSYFLALDKNNDGKINDGSELFGTKSGDGFKDLAKYDSDKNGWIDENDSVFKNLKVWGISAEGTMRLISIKDAKVGAIYLGNTITNMSLTSYDMKDVGVVRKSGVFLKENGESGVIQHIDLIA